MLLQWSETVRHFDKIMQWLRVHLAVAAKKNCTHEGKEMCHGMKINSTLAVNTKEIVWENRHHFFGRMLTIIASHECGIVLCVFRCREQLNNFECNGIFHRIGLIAFLLLSKWVSCNYCYNGWYWCKRKYSKQWQFAWN